MKKIPWCKINKTLSQSQINNNFERQSASIQSQKVDLVCTKWVLKQKRLDP